MFKVVCVSHSQADSPYRERPPWRSIHKKYTFDFICFQAAGSERAIEVYRNPLDGF